MQTVATLTVFLERLAHDVELVRRNVVAHPVRAVVRKVELVRGRVPVEAHGVPDAKCVLPVRRVLQRRRAVQGHLQDGTEDGLPTGSRLSARLSQTWLKFQPTFVLTWSSIALPSSSTVQMLHGEPTGTYSFPSGPSRINFHLRQAHGQ